MKKTDVLQSNSNTFFLHSMRFKNLSKELQSYRTSSLGVWLTPISCPANLLTTLHNSYLVSLSSSTKSHKSGFSDFIVVGNFTLNTNPKVKKIYVQPKRSKTQNTIELTRTTYKTTYLKRPKVYLSWSKWTKKTRLRCHPWVINFLHSKRRWLRDSTETNWTNNFWNGHSLNSLAKLIFQQKMN